MNRPQDPTLSKERMRVESYAKVSQALKLIEQAQNDLNSACAALSTLVGGVPVWRATSKMSDKVRDLWYRVDRFRNGRRYYLDNLTVGAMLAREAEVAANEGHLTKGCAGSWVDVSALGDVQLVEKCTGCRGVRRRTRENGGEEGPSASPSVTD